MPLSFMIVVTQPVRHAHARLTVAVAYNVVATRPTMDVIYDLSLTFSFLHRRDKPGANFPRNALN